jgi:hypothetical protein
MVNLTWQPSDAGEPAVWEGNKGGLPVVGQNEPARVALTGQTAGFARLIPGRWSPKEDALQLLAHATQHPTPLGHYSGLNWSPTTGGFIVYRANRMSDAHEGVTTATRWYRATGELWGTDTDFLQEYENKKYFTERYALRHWYAWLKQNIIACLNTGGSFPMRVRLGLEGLAGVRGLFSGIGLRHIHALEERVVHEFALARGDEETLAMHLRSTHNKVREAFGLEQLSGEQFATLFQKVMDEA